MKKRAHIYVNYKNMVVLQNYLDIIRKGLLLNGYSCDDVTSLDGLNKDDLYVFPMGIDAFKFYFRGYKNFILWQQGATADESYMRNHSKLRYKILNLMDCFAMKKARLVFFCSAYMKIHYEKLAKCSFADKSYLMPCYNEELSIGSIENKDYSKKNFTYVGSLDLWQCFDEIAAIYKVIEDQIPDTFFKVLTFSTNEALRKIKELGIKNYEVKSVSKEQVQKELQDTVYGFIIRKDSIVNKVATPTKISSYMSVGIIPIFSTVLDDFWRVSNKMKYVLPVDQNSNISSLINFINSEIDKAELTSEYSEIFSTYYGTENHINNISRLVHRLDTMI